jgi:hypothetical protein
MSDLVLPTVFLVVSLHKVQTLVAAGYFGLDFRVYRAAAAAALAGGDPWLVDVAGFRFGGPPPTLLAYVPAAFVPEFLGAAAYLLVSVGAALYAVRALRLPYWWLLFPPLVESGAVLNPDVLMVALLVATGRVAGLAVPLKVYGAIPLLAQRRFGAVAVGLAVCALTLPLWATFVADRSVIVSAFDAQSAGLSAWGTWWLFVPAALAVFALRRSGGDWLAVPALWPYTQLHYATIALPALRHRPLLALALSFGYPLLAPAAIIGQALWETWRVRRARATEAQGVLRPVEASL